MQDIENNHLNLSRYLDNEIEKHSMQMKEWIQLKYNSNDKPFYGSVDIRNSGFKVAPVDTNLFPAGFNNLDEKGLLNAQREFSQLIKNKSTHKILIIPENFTRNLNYFENLIALKRSISSSNIEVEFGSPHLSTLQEYIASETFTIYPLSRNQNKVVIKHNWEPDLIILNTDLTSGIPNILENLNQTITPAISKGWHTRRKFNHFTIYNKIANEFCSEFKLDPWLISTYIDKYENVDFRNKIGLEESALAVENTISKIKLKYKEYNINSTPYVFIKADNGTFGMGIMAVNSGEEILNINKKKRHSMDVIKEGVFNREILIQEGVPTIYTKHSAPYENVAYSVNGSIISFLRRVNSSRDHLSNLNSPTAQFECDSDFTYTSEALVAELALLATVYE